MGHSGPALTCEQEGRVKLDLCLKRIKHLRCIKPGVLESTVGVHVVFCLLSLESRLVVVRHLLKHGTRHFVQVVPSESGNMLVKMFYKVKKAEM